MSLGRQWTGPHGGKEGKQNRDGSVGGGENRATQQDRRKRPTLGAEDLRARNEGEERKEKWRGLVDRGRERRGRTEAEEQSHPSDRKTSTRGPTVVPGDATFSGWDISGSYAEERTTLTNRLFQRHNQEEFIRTTL
jgi:hypothetical protein